MQGCLSLWSWGATLPACGWSPTQNSPNPALQAFPWGLHQIGLVRYQLHRQPLSPSQSVGDRAETLSSRPWLGLPGDHPGAGGSPPAGTSLEQRHRCHPGNPAGRRSSAPGAGAENSTFGYSFMRHWDWNKSFLGDTIHIKESSSHLHTVLICSCTCETYTYV